MREDERQPLSRAILQKKMREEAKFSAGSSLIPLLFVTLLAILFTVIVSNLTQAPPFFWGFLVMGVLPVWGVAVYLARDTVKKFRFYRRTCGEDLVTIVTDRVVDLTEEMVLRRAGRSSHYDKACILYLESHGRHVINMSLWTILHVDDEVYVAVVMDKGVGVYGIYSPKMHKVAEAEIFR